jgi:hypothetical protein
LAFNNPVIPVSGLDEISTKALPQILVPAGDRQQPGDQRAEKRDQDGLISCG